MAFSRKAALAAFLTVAASASPAFAQQQPEWFVPGGQQGQQRPAAPRAAQQAPRAAQPPRAQAPAPLPPGQSPPNAVIGIVDVPEIQRVSTAFNQVRDEIEKRRQKLNDDLQREQNSWREQQQQLAAQRASLQPDQLRQKERDLQDRITDSQQIFRDRSRAIEQAAQQALMQIEQTLGVVIRQVAASRSVNIVLPRPLVIFNEPSFDLTAEIAQQFNKVLPKVDIPAENAKPETAPAAPAAAAPAHRGRGN